MPRNHRPYPPELRERTLELPFVSASRWIASGSSRPPLASLAASAEPAR